MFNNNSISVKITFNIKNNLVTKTLDIINVLIIVFVFTHMTHRVKCTCNLICWTLYAYLLFVKYVYSLNISHFAGWSHKIFVTIKYFIQVIMIKCFLGA